MKLKNIVIDLSSCIYCTGPLIKHDKDCLICSACKRKYDIINRQLIINQFDALENRVERDLPPFSPRKGQSNWRALNYSEIFDFFLDQNENKKVLLPLLKRILLPA